jgi:hypothetical protein
MFLTQELFRITFNTAFIGTDNLLEVNRNEISPECLQKNTSRFTDLFKCKLYFKDFCKNGCQSNKTPLLQICKECKNIMMTEIDKWNEATTILKSNPRFSVD